MARPFAAMFPCRRIGGCNLQFLAISSITKTLGRFGCQTSTLIRFRFVLGSIPGRSGNQLLFDPLDSTLEFFTEDYLWIPRSRHNPKDFRVVT
jgi:hypothetical protein